MSFVLSNPVLNGGADITSNEQSRNEAAKDIWLKFSKNIKNCTPNFYFSIKNTENGSYSHYKVSEKVAKNKKVGMKLRKLGKNEINNHALEQLENNDFQINSDNESSIGMSGGSNKYKKYDLDSDDKSSSSSSSSSYEKIRKRKTKGLKLLYAPGIYNVATIGLPIMSSYYASTLALIGLSQMYDSMKGKSVSNLSN
jgi:hypothetical protein